ncbi:uncharacterized protein PAC_11263 [Phialocephala subalpina]|uniref:N-acetyltransferase domain-containing protein n=1 Tax=Phialocephala subalpina TaxID=576137 RepID=A0A1L7X8Q2_9HELO|nr:uncharacterized protein PAC_11263 [Phialocephala subalpina]
MSAPKTPPPRYLSTERLALELFSRANPKHYEVMLGCINNEISHASMSDYGIRTTQQFDRLNEATFLTYPVAFPQELSYIASLKESPPTPVGAVTLAQRSRQFPPDIGWAILPEFMGNGYATEAAKEFLRWVTEDWRLEICTWPDEGNRKSVRVAEKLGFVDGGVVRSLDEDALVKIWVLPGMKKVDADGVMSVSLWGEGKSKEDVIGK